MRAGEKRPESPRDELICTGIYDYVLSVIAVGRTDGWNQAAVAEGFLVKGLDLSVAAPNFVFLRLPL